MQRTLCLVLASVLLSISVPVVADGYSDMLAKAETYLASNDYAKAIACYQLAEKIDSGNEQAFLGEAGVQIILGDYAAAAAAINSALEINPTSSAAWLEKCRIDLLLEDVSSLKQDVVFAEVCDTDLADVYPSAASLYASAGYYEEAAASFALVDMDSLSEALRSQYRKALLKSRKREDAERIGLVAVPVRNTHLDSAFDGDDTLPLRV